MYTFKTLPRNHQLQAVRSAKEWLEQGNPYYAFYMEQGTGKSKVLIDLCSDLFARNEIDAVLLVAPNGVHEQWANEQIPEHSPLPYTTYEWEGMPKRQARLEPLRRFCWTKSRSSIRWLCVNVEAFSTDGSMSVFQSFVKRNRCAVIIDECTTIKNIKAHCTQNISLGLSNCLYEGKYLTKIEPYAKYRFVLTGTLVTNNPFDQYSYGEFLKPKMWGQSEYGFRLRYGILTRMTYRSNEKDNKGSKIVHRLMNTEQLKKIHKQIEEGFQITDIAYSNKTSTDVVLWLKAHPNVVVPYRNLSELKERIKQWSFVCLKKDCLDLPEKQRLITHYELSKEQKRIYKELCDDFFSEYGDNELEVTTKLTLITRLAQVTGGFFPHTDGTKATPIEDSNKLKAVAQQINEMDERPIIIVARFTAEIELLAERFGAEKLYGATNDRGDLRERFQRGEVPILAVNPAVGAMGYNFQNSCNMFFYSNDFSLLKREQMEDRIHREGQKSEHVVYRDFIAKGTVEERIYSVLRNKKDLLEYMRDIKDVKEFVGA